MPRQTQQRRRQYTKAEPRRKITGEATGGNTETKNGRDSDVADNEPKHTKEAVHRKEGPNLKLTNITNDRDAKTEKKTTNVANL